MKSKVVHVSIGYYLLPGTVWQYVLVVKSCVGYELVPATHINFTFGP